MDGPREISGVSQSEKNKYHMISLICGIQETNKLIETEQIVVARWEGVVGRIGEKGEGIHKYKLSVMKTATGM